MKLKKSDYITLGKAVSRFNKLINEINNKKSYTPSTVNYKELKDNIFSKKEFNKVLNSLKSATKENLRETTMLGDMLITQYEYQNIKRNQKSALSSLKYQLKKQQAFDLKKGKIWKKEQNKILQTINIVKDLENRSGGKLLTSLTNIERNSNSRDLRRDYNFRNFYEKNILPYLENYDGFDRLKKELDKIKSPKKFYEFIKQSEILSDIGNIEYGDSLDEEKMIMDIRQNMTYYAMKPEEAFIYAIENELGL